jgi:hypothetical protein
MRSANRTDYVKLVDQFGTKLIDDTLLERFERVTGQKPHRFLRRQIAFSHRQLDVILDKYEQNVSREPISVTCRLFLPETVHAVHRKRTQQHEYVSL